MNEKQFQVLAALSRTRGLSQRDLAAETGMSLGSVSTALADVRAAGWVAPGVNQVTEAGKKALEPYRVQNAIIMAAGLSSRFAPISFEKPKGVLTVRGEVLIERQIRQLHEAGITDITIVVGYKQEYFFYLEDLFGVRIVVNDAFATRNNNSTLWVARNLLGRTYICSSDNYFTENPFSPYAYKAYYAAEFADGPTQEWCMQEGAHGRIKGVAIGGEHAWYMTGHAFFDQAFSDQMVRILQAEYNLPQTADKLWEELFADHIREFDMVIKKYPKGTIWEFDSIDELRQFDPFFIENVDSQALSNICSVLDCTKDEIHDIYPLKQGITNLSCHFATNSGEYVYRHPGIGTEVMIDRGAEVAANEQAHAIGIDDTFLFEDAQTGWKVSRFVPHARVLDPHDAAQVKRAMELAAWYHAQPMQIERTFSFFDEGCFYERALLEHGPIDVHGYADMRASAARLAAYVAADNAPVCLTHNDFLYLNILLDDSDKMYLIDWEYAGMGDYANDFGTFVVTSELSETEAEQALSYYFGRTPTFEETRHNLAMVALAGWCWYVWALAKEAEGDHIGEWLYIYYNYGKKYLDKVLPMYEVHE